MRTRRAAGRYPAGFLVAALCHRPTSPDLGGSFLHCFAFVIPAMRTSLMRLLHLMAMRTLSQRRLRQMVVRPPRAGSPLRMASLWIRHRTAPCSLSVNSVHAQSVCRVAADGLPQAGLMPLSLLLLREVHRQLYIGTIKETSRLSSFVAAVLPHHRSAPLLTGLYSCTLILCTARTFFATHHTVKGDRHHEKSIVS